MQFILCLVYIPVDTSNMTYLSHITLGSFLVIKTMKLLFYQFTVLTRVTGFNGHSDYRSSVKVQITEGSAHQRAGYCG